MVKVKQKRSENDKKRIKKQRKGKKKKGSIMLVNNREQYRLDNFFSPFDASSASKAKLKLKPIHTVNKTKGKESRSNPQPA